MAIYGAAIVARPLREFTRFIWWMQNERQMANWLCYITKLYIHYHSLLNYLVLLWAVLLSAP